MTEQLTENPTRDRRRALLAAMERLDGLEAERETLGRRLAEVSAAHAEALAEYRAAVLAEWQAAEPGCKKAQKAAPDKMAPETLAGPAMLAACLAPMVEGEMAPAPATAPGANDAAETRDDAALPPCPEGAKVIADRVEVAPGAAGRLFMRADGDFELHALPPFGTWDDPDLLPGQQAPADAQVGAACAAAAALPLAFDEFYEEADGRYVFRLECPELAHPEAWRTVDLFGRESLRPLRHNAHLSTLGEVAEYVQAGRKLEGIKGVTKGGWGLIVGSLRDLWLNETAQGARGEWPVWMPSLPKESAPVEPAPKKEKKPKAAKKRPCCPICARPQDDPRASACRRCAGAKAIGAAVKLFVAGVGDLPVHCWHRTDGSTVLRAKQWPGAGPDDEAALGRSASVMFGRPLEVAVIADVEGDQTHPIVIELEPASEPAARAEPSGTTGDLFPGASEPAGASHTNERL